MNKNKVIEYSDLSIKIYDENISLDALEKKYMDAIGKIFNKIKKAINKQDEIQKNNSIVDKWFKNEFNNFVSALRQLKIELPNNVDEQYFQGNGGKGVVDQIYKLNMGKEYQKHLEDKY